MREGPGRPGAAPPDAPRQGGKTKRRNGTIARDTRSDDEKRYDPSPIEFEPGEDGFKKPVRGQYFFQHAVRSNYAGYDLLGKDYYDEHRNGPVREELYLGLAKNYNNRGDYDNSDGSLIFVSDNARIWGLLAGDGYTVSQQRLIDEKDFRESDYEEYYRLNYEGGRLQSLPKTCEVRFCAGRGEGPDSGLPFRYPDWRREDPETVRLDEEERKIADARAEVRDYRGVEAEDADALLLYATKVGPEGEYRVYGDRAAAAAELCGLPVERRDLGFGISPATLRVSGEDLGAAVGALLPVFRVRIVSDGKTLAVLPRLGGGLLSRASAPGAGPDDGPAPAGVDPDGTVDGAPDEHPAAYGEYDEYDEDEEYGDDEEDDADGFREDMTMLRVRGETARIMKGMDIEIYTLDGFDPVSSSRDIDPDGVYAIRKGRWEAFTASDDGKDYMYALKNLEDATADYLEASGASEAVLDVLRSDSEETARSIGGRRAARVSAFQTEELLKIFASRTAAGGEAFRAAEREIASRAADERVRAVGLALVERQEAEAFAREELKRLGFSEGLEYGLTDEERTRAAELLEGPYGERTASFRPGSYADYLAGPLGDALFALSVSGDPRDRREEVKRSVADSYRSFTEGHGDGVSHGDETVGAYGLATMTALRDAVMGNLLSEGAYRALSEEDDPLRGMFDEYTEKEYPGMATAEDAAGFAEGYCERFHPDVMERTPSYRDDACPVYAGDRASAAARGETDMYEASLAADARCARDIGDALRDAVPAPGAADEITRRYGRERVEEVILRHMSGLGWDEKLPRKETAAAEELYPEPGSPDRIGFEADPELLNLFVKGCPGLFRQNGPIGFGRALPGEGNAPFLTEFDTDENPFEDAGAAGAAETTADKAAEKNAEATAEETAVETAEETAADGAEKRPDTPGRAEKPEGGEDAAEKKTVWVRVFISPGDVLRQDDERNTIVVAMPDGGRYAGYEAWVSRSYVFDAYPGETERFGGPVVKVCLPEDRHVNLYSRGRDRVKLGAREFAAAVKEKDGPVNGLRGRVEFEVPDSSLKEVKGGCAVLRMPAGDRTGYTVSLPSKFVDTETRRGDGMLAVSLPSSSVWDLYSRRMEFSSMTVSAERLEMCMGGAPREAFEYPDDAVPADTGLNSKEEHDLLVKAMAEADAAERDARAAGYAEAAERADEAAAGDDVRVTLPAHARVADYGGDGVYAMPKGAYRGYFFHCPDDRAEFSEDGTTVTLTLDRYGDVRIFDTVNDRETEVTPDFFVRMLGEKDWSAWGGGYGVEERKDDFYMNGDTLEALPAEMRKKPNWVGIRVMPGKEGGRLKKLPVDPHTGNLAKSDDKTTWGTFGEAIAFARSNRCSAIAYALDGRDGICCIDMDGCVGENGQTAAAKEVLGSLPAGAYVEKSVSGTGIHVFAKSDRFTDLRTFSRDGSMEFYRRSHFMTVTGNTMSPPGRELVSLDGSGVAGILAARFDRRQDMRSYRGGCGMEGVSSMSDREVLEKAFSSRGGETFRALYEGQDLKGNHSNSDMALMGRLAFWCHGDKEQMIRIFQSSGLYRPEKSQDYYECTAIKAIRTVDDRYGADGPGERSQSPAAKEGPECEGKVR